MKAIVYSKNGNKKGEVVLNPEIFAANVNHRLLELVKNAFSANLRHGTADTKTRKEVRGGGKKPWKQKGTGRARHGSTRSPIWKGGGVVFGPHPRSYYVNLPKTMKDAALISALSLKGDEKKVCLLEDAKLDSAKTKEWAGIVKALPLDGKSTLCVVKNIDDNLHRASRNLENWVKVCKASDVNAYHILNKERIVIEQDAVQVIESRLTGSPVSGSEPKAEKKAKAPKAAKTKTAAPKAAAKKTAKKKS